MEINLISVAQQTMEALMRNVLQILTVFFVFLAVGIPNAFGQSDNPWTVEGRKAWIDEVNGVEPAPDYSWAGDEYVVETHEPSDSPTLIDDEQLGPETYDADNPGETVPFWDDLNGRGAWVWTDELGWAWMPSDREEDWQPYQNGQWYLTDAGWAFESHEDYGPIVYHYGRWVSLAGYGWVWVPGRRWAPAWVSWRVSDGYVGWCPMAPRYYGYYGVYMTNPTYWSFVETRYFLSPGVYRVVVPRYRARNIYRSTRRIARSHRYGRARFNPGPNPKRIRHYVGRAPQRRSADTMRRRAVPRATERRVPPRSPGQRAVPRSPRRSPSVGAQPQPRYRLRGKTVNPRARQQPPSRPNKPRFAPGAGASGSKGAQRKPAAAPERRAPSKARNPRAVPPGRRVMPQNRNVRPSKPSRRAPSAQPRTQNRPQRAVRPPSSNRRVKPTNPRVRRPAPQGGINRSKAKTRQERRKRRDNSGSSNSRGRRPSRSRGR